MEERNKMKIGFDLDDVVADFFPAFLRFYNQRHNQNYSLKDIISYWIWEVGIGKDKEEAIALVDEFHDSECYDDSPPVKGAREGLEELKQLHPVLYIVTSRPLRFREKTDRFIGNHFSEIPLTMCYSNDFHDGSGYSKADIGKNLGLDLFVEDCLKYGVALAKAGIPTLLLDRPWNQNGQPLGNITRVYNWEEIVREIKQKGKTKHGI